MILSNDLTSQCIIIAGNPPGFTAKIKPLLSNKGFENLRLASNGKEVYDTVRSMAEFPDQMGMIIVHQDLQDCQVYELCKIFSCSGHQIDIPIIVIGREGSEWQAKHGLSVDCLVYNLYESFSNTELIAVVELLLTLKRDRAVGASQQEQLINELDEQKILDAKVRYLSEHDELTGLLTRSSFESQLTKILQRNNDINRNGCLLLIEMDRFRLVNKLEGVDEGDRLIIEVVGLIRRTIRDENLFSRLGYDEYGIYIDNVSEAAANHVTERIREALAQFRFLSGENCYNLSVAIGQAMLRSEKAPSHPEDFISRSRQASKIAKLMGRNQVWQYDLNDSRIQQKNNDIVWFPIIRSALEEDRFFLEFQPIIDISNGKILNYEVLVRMSTITNEVIHSNDFISIAERIGLISSIDSWVIEKAIFCLANMPDEMNQVSFSINLSSQTIADDTLLPKIKQQLELCSVNAGRLCFEIKETAMIDNLEKARQTMLNLKSLGCRFALDDFGSGFSSFSYLRVFQVDYLKINQQLIQRIESNETDRILVESLCNMAKKLRLKTIVKHIEIPETLAAAKKLGIDFGQGYLLANPKIDIKGHDALGFLEKSKIN